MINPYRFARLNMVGVCFIVSFEVFGFYQIVCKCVTVLKSLTGSISVLAQLSERQKKKMLLVHP